MTLTKLPGQVMRSAFGVESRFPAPTNYETIWLNQLFSDLNFDIGKPGYGDNCEVCDV